MTDIDYILTDIEGTTTSISFVHSNLFPYSKLRIKSFVNENIDNPSLKKYFHDILLAMNPAHDESLDKQKIIYQLLEWIDQDKKHPSLKFIQGIIWEEGYLSGKIQGHLYPDVPEAFNRWKGLGLKLGIFSSGSVHAQKLLFKYSIYGDMTIFIDNYFDTSVGAKGDVSSYLQIADQLQLPPNKILFLSDISSELEAACAGGFKTIQLRREGSVTLGSYQSAQSFGEIF